jgi:hypothetical protein
MISVTFHANTARLLGFVPYAEKQLSDLAEHATAFGQDRMTDLVPKRTHRLQAAIFSITRDVTPAHTIGFVGIDMVAAPYADYVDKGTGVDGPFGKPVTVLRPARDNRRGGGRRERARPGRSQAGDNRYTTNGQTGVMTFQKNGEPRRFRKTVKATPSIKIQRGKGYVARAQRDTRDFTHIQTGVLAVQLAAYFTAE